MKDRLAYLGRFVALIMGSFLLQKTIFILYNYQLIGSMSCSDYLAVLWHGLSLDFAVVGYLIALPLMLVLVSYAFRSFPARGVFLVYHALIAVVLSLVFIGDTGLYPFWGFKLDATIFQYLDSPQNAFASVSLLFLCIGILMAVLWAGGLFFLLQRAVGKSWERGRSSGDVSPYVPRNPWGRWAVYDECRAGVF